MNEPTKKLIKHRRIVLIFGHPAHSTTSRLFSDFHSMRIKNEISLNMVPPIDFEREYLNIPVPYGNPHLSDAMHAIMGSRLGTVDGNFSVFHQYNVWGGTESDDRRELVKSQRAEWKRRKIK